MISVLIFYTVLFQSVYTFLLFLYHVPAFFLIIINLSQIIREMGLKPRYFDFAQHIAL